MPGFLTSHPWEVEQRPRPRPPVPVLADLLAFAGSPDHMNARKIRERFSLSPLQYAAELNRVIDTDLALRLNPVLVARLRAERDARRERRAVDQLIVVCQICGTDVGPPYEAGLPVRCSNCGANVYTKGRR